jgi:hypothetical protein
MTLLSLHTQVTAPPDTDSAEFSYSGNFCTEPAPPWRGDEMWDGMPTSVPAHAIRAGRSDG